MALENGISATPADAEQVGTTTPVASVLDSLPIKVRRAIDNHPDLSREEIDKVAEQIKPLIDNAKIPDFLPLLAGKAAREMARAKTTPGEVTTVFTPATKGRRSIRRSRAI